MLMVPCIQAKPAAGSYPVGSVFHVPEVAVASADGVVPCDGRLLRNEDYPELFSVVGYSYAPKVPVPTWRNAVRRLFGLPQETVPVFSMGVFHLPDYVGKTTI
jgi:hypothetical protein